MNKLDDSSCWDSIRFGNFTLLPRARSLEFDGALLPIGSRAIEILTLLVERAGTVVGKDELMARAWPHVTIDPGGLKVQIAYLRKLIGDGRNGNRYIATVNGRGYIFVTPTIRTDSDRAIRSVRVSSAFNEAPAV